MPRRALVSSIRHEPGGQRFTSTDVPGCHEPRGDASRRECHGAGQDDVDDPSAELVGREFFAPHESTHDGPNHDLDQK
jgi:hypothetical protein